MNVKSDLAELQHITPIATYESPLYILKDGMIFVWERRWIHT